MRESTKLPSSPANNLIRMSPGSGDLNQSSVTTTIKARRRRFKFRQLKYTCQTVSTNGSINGDQKQERKKQSESSKNGYQDSVKISVSLSTTENDVVLSRLEDGRIPELKRYGVVSVIGRRREMEDAVRAELGFLERGGQIYDFYGVYDGHGGAHVANTCRERFHDVVAKEVELTGEGQIGKEVEWERLMKGCFGKLDDEVKEIAAAKTVGATAVVAVVGDEVVVIANCGDCRAVISRAGIALPLSTDHKPDRPDELMRIEAAGGKVINWNGYRVLGVLATSRSIGDKCLKPFVISTPEVTVRKRTDDDEFLILASDGLWDVISNELACQVVKKCLKGQMRRSISKEIQESSTSMAAAVLAELAMARGSRDNISVIVVELSKHY